MATIRKRGNRWQVQVRRRGVKPVSRSFLRKEDALGWARKIETAIDRGSYVDRSCLARITLGELLVRYRDTVSVRKRSHSNEKIILNALIARPFSNDTLDRMSADVFSAYRDGRLQKVKPATINRELGIIQHAFDIARDEWALPIRDNPVKGVRRPRVANQRARRLLRGEEERLLDSASKSRNQLMRPLIELAIQTGMRRGELLGLRRDHVDWAGKLLDIPFTKNGSPRTIPLTPRAVALLSGLDYDINDGRLFSMSEYAVRHAWRRIIDRAGITDLHFHDLRHEAISRFFEMGLSVPEVALISGHKNLGQLSRYTHMRAACIVPKLRSS